MIYDVTEMLEWLRQIGLQQTFLYWRSENQEAGRLIPKEAEIGWNKQLVKGFHVVVC